MPHGYDHESDDMQRDREYVQGLRHREPTTLRGRLLTPQDVLQVMTDLDNEVKRTMQIVAEQSSRFPAEPPTGSVLRWERRFRSDDPHPYTYIALRINEHWYLTGRRNQIVLWEDLVKLIGDSPCWLVTKYREVPRPAPDPLDSVKDPDEWFSAVFGDGVSTDEVAEKTNGS